MRTIFAFVIFIASIGCTTIDNLEPNQTETFLKFYSETNEMNSKDLAVLSDGYLILSTYNETSSLLLKTDLNGNKLWAQAFDNFQGNSLAVLDDGYILIGDRINNDKDSTYMQLIKTNTSGESPILTQVGNGSQHGTAVTISSNQEVYALGYSTSGDSVMLLAYQSDLSQRLWFRQYRSSISSKSIYEKDNGNITWLSYSDINGGIHKLTLADVIPDNESPVDDNPLFNEKVFSNLDGDIAKIPTGFAVVQTILENGKSKIGLSIGSDETVLELGSPNSNFVSGSITDASNGLLIAASTDNHDENERTDKDLLLLEVNYNGTVKSNGINITYGGAGDEIPVRIRKTNDGGYVVLGTSINSKGAQQTFLLKTNSKGALN